MPGIANAISPCISYIAASGGSPSFAYDGFFIPKTGQSNWTPRYSVLGNLPIAQQAVLTGVFNYNYNSGSAAFTPFQSSVNDNWGHNIVAPNPGATLDFNNVADTFCKGNSLGYKMHNTYGLETYFVPVSLGGTGLDPVFLSDPFTPACWDADTVGSLYDNFIAKTIAAWNAAVALGKNLYPILIWDQGENDADYAGGGPASRYYANLVNFESKTRIALSGLSPLFATCPFIVSSLRPSTPFAYRDVIQRAQVQFVVDTPNAYLHNMFKPATPIAADGNHDTPIVDNYVGVLGAINAGEEYADLIYRLVVNPFVDDGFIHATGGEISVFNTDYQLHNFKTHGVYQVFIAPTGVKITDYNLIAGGASGGVGSGASGGPGGAGGVILGTNRTVTVGKKPVFTGRGGITNGLVTSRGTSGEDTTFDGLTAIGGGGGGGFDGINPDQDGLSGGSGGAGANFSPGGNPGLGTAGQGHNGGGAVTYPFFSSGAGGAGGIGQTGTDSKAGDGGPGIIWIDGEYYGGGGGGSVFGFSGITGVGGIGGGGDGQNRGVSAAGNGQDYKGGGGGGVSNTGDPGANSRGGYGAAKLITKFQN